MSPTARRRALQGCALAEEPAIGTLDTTLSSQRWIVWTVHRSRHAESHPSSTNRDLDPDVT